MRQYCIAVGADHRGATDKQRLLEGDNRYGDSIIDWEDMGCSSLQQACDYPLYARYVCQKVVKKPETLGLLLCGTGVGMAIAANRFAGIYAALCWNSEVAALARSHDHANVLVVPSDYVDFTQLQKMIVAFVSTEPLQDYHAQRVQLIEAWGGLDP